MNSNAKILGQIMEQFIRVMNKFNRLDRIPMDFGIEQMLFPSEIHTIEAIGRNRGINVTELAEILGITKGAASQMVKKLLQKGLVAKLKHHVNDKELILKLTAKGENAFQDHEKFHREMHLDFVKYAAGISSGDFRKFKEILIKIERHIDLYPETLF